MDSKVVAPITKLKARNAWGLQSEIDLGSEKKEVSVDRLKEGEKKKNGAGGVGGPVVVGGGGGKCTCCPYGFHIDLDFVRYCESLASGDYLRQLKQLHRSRRRQRKSIEALLGFHEDLRRKRSTVPCGGSVQDDSEAAAAAAASSSSVCGHPPDLVNTGDVLKDALRDAMHDFEETFNKSSKVVHSGNGSCERKPPPNHLDLAPIDLLTNAHNLSVSSSSEGSSSSDSPNLPLPPFSLLYSSSDCGGLLPLSSRCRSDSIGSLSTISTSSTTTATETMSCCSSSSVVVVAVPPPSKHMADTMETLANASSNALFYDGGDSSSVVSIDRRHSLSPSSSSSMVGINPIVLQSIRDQMAISLHRMKELEEHAKAVPVLQVKLSVLKEEKRLLMLQLKAKGAAKVTNQRLENGHPVLSARQSEKSEASVEQHILSQQMDSLPKRTRTMSISCSVLTREVGVGNVPVSVRSIGVDNLDSPELCLECQRRNLTNSSTVSRAVNTEPHKLAMETCEQVNIEPVSTSMVCNSCEQKRLKLYSSVSIATDDIHVTNKSTSTVVPSAVQTHATGVQVHPTCRNVQLQTSLDANPPSKPHQTRDQRVGCSVDVRHVGTNAVVPNKVTIAKKDCAVGGDSSVFNVVCDECSSRKAAISQKRTVGVGLYGVKDLLLCDRCTGVRTCSVGVGTTDSRGVRAQTRSVASGLCTVGDLLCDRCSRLRTSSVGVATDPSAGDVSQPQTSKAVNLCDKCSADITSAAKDLLGRSEQPGSDEGVLSPIIEVSARREAAKTTGQEFRKRRLPMEFYINRGYGEKEDAMKVVSRKHTTEGGGGRSVRKGEGGENGSECSGSSDNESSSSSSSGSSSDSPDEGSYYSVSRLIVNTCQDDEAIREGRPGAVMFQPIQEPSRKKYEFSEAMIKACEILNEHLKNPSLEAKSKEVNSSLNVIRSEWFRVFCQKNMNQNAVEDYLDALESTSHVLIAKVVNLTDASGNTAMHYAISYANFDVVSLLLDSKVCNINKPNKAGYTCLMLASLATVKEESFLSVLKQLFKLGDVNMKASQHGQTALMLAASHGKVEMVRLLLEAGADINIQDEDGSTALMCASEHGHLGVVRCLLSNVDCDPNLADKDGSTALSIAMEAGHKDVGLMIYAATSLSRGSSPYASLRLKRRGSTPTRSTSTPPPHPPSPAWSRKSTSSVP